MAVDWGAGWQEKVTAKARSLGHESVSSFLAACPGLPYPEAAAALSPDVAPLQLSTVQFDEAQPSGRLREAAKDALVRQLRQALQEGWGRDSKTSHVEAGSCWITSISFRAPQRSHFYDIATAVWKELSALGIPEGWIPRDMHDEWIARAFGIAWPLGQE